MIKKRALGGVGLFRDMHLDAHQLGFVREQINETCMRRTKILVVALAQVGSLFPLRIYANHQMPDAFQHKQINDAT
ncbi:hypothetical protein KSX_56520 [Ktedonospora formicarum]|uniref:Uncharacterized protein n=1 Tax=Ktedonospora formicarum TaxID=2778364 RepID=A0A8J3I1A3_9CHLR|nr:hypothetical protein KSX_56520 [Ktedonospora formicarum]